MKKYEKKVYLFSISSHPNATHVNSLDITFLKPDIDFSCYDYFIITSKQASYALKQYDKEKYIEKKALCISKQSAKAFEEVGGCVLEIGEGYGDTLKAKIQAYPKTTKWLYLRAKVVASDFVKEPRSDGYKIDEVVVYESDCSSEIKNIEVEVNATLIFTSPSSVKCFLKNHKIDKQNSIIVIGSTTAKAFCKNIELQIAQENTINSCFELV